LPQRIDPEAASVALSGALFYRRLMTDERSDRAYIETLVDTVLGG
jgi:hypothetical protein